MTRGPDRPPHTGERRGEQSPDQNRNAESLVSRSRACDLTKEGGGGAEPNWTKQLSGISVPSFHTTSARKNLGAGAAAPYRISPNSQPRHHIDAGFRAFQ